MDSQSFDYWLSQGNYLPPHQTNVFELPPDLSSVPSLSGSPVSISQCSVSESSQTNSLKLPRKVSSHFDQAPVPVYQGHYPHIAEEMNFNYQLPLTPSDFGSADESPYCSPRPRQTELAYSAPAERTHTTSGVSFRYRRLYSKSQRLTVPPQRRRAQNRAAQRAFRERKEKHAKDLESQLAALTEKYRNLESSHTELNAAYNKLRKTIELLTKDDGEERPPSNADTLRKLLDILHGEFKVKGEN